MNQRELKEKTTLTILPSVKKQAIIRANSLKRSLSSHVEFLLETDLSESKVAGALLDKHFASKVRPQTANGRFNEKNEFIPYDDVKSIEMPYSNIKK